MEPDAILNMVEDVFFHRFFIIYAIVRNDYGTMWAGLKHSSRGARGQVLNSFKGKLDEEIPVPSFLVDYSHSVKVVDKHIFSILKNGKAQQCVCTKAYYFWLKNYWGYMINNNRNKSLDELRHASKVPFKHMFNSHDNCSVEWCFNKISSV